MSFLSASPILQPATSLSVKKRKRDDTTNTNTPAEIDSRPFAIRPAGDDLLGKTTNLAPICVLKRAHLPLAALDVQGSRSGLFAAHVQTLEALYENGIEGLVLVAEQKEEGRLYVVERAARRVYALCRLGRWITKETLSRLVQVQPEEAAGVAKRRVTDPTITSPWWSRAAVDLPKERSQAHANTPKLWQFKLPTQVSKVVSDTASIEAGIHSISMPGGTHVQQASNHQKPDTAFADPEYQDPVEELAKHYLDALYLSRTSLAYFAKGPLSRARSTITGGVNTLSASSDLVDFLRNSILPVNVMDKKFKDNIPAFIKDLPVVAPTQDDKPVKSRKKKKFKPKRDKAGLFTNEQEYLEKWWRGEEISGSMTSPENVDTASRRRIPGLRSRETYLQVIIILETLYLETTNKSTSSLLEDSSLALDSKDAEIQDAEPQATSETTKRKGKKALELRSLLETLLDRLCIWQDLDAHAPTNILGGRDANHNQPGNELRDFCVEIIVPFFLTRLPKEAALVNKKLGGPSPPSPEKRKSVSSRSRPGEPATRSRPEKLPRKPLARVATETLNQTARHIPSLHRSATDSTLIKREDSQPALSSIPPVRPQSRPARESALSSYLSGHRQVDLAAKSAAATERLRKKKETEAQVREAIANARKPNRPMATKEVAARADEKFSQSLPKSVRSSIHVAATPKRSHHHHQNLTTTALPSFIPTSAHSSNSSVVPASSVRPRLGPRIDSLPAVPQTADRETALARHASGVEETPSRGSGGKFALFSPSARCTAPIGFSLAESPSVRRSSGRGLVAAKPVRGVGRKVDFGGGRGSGVVVEATPVKKGEVGGIFERKDEGDVGVGGVEVGVEFGETSIYDVWNDDYEELA
jgi:DNA replication regulator SLD3